MSDRIMDIDDLRRIMRAAAGEEEAVDLDGDIHDVPFTDLGYDSLALLEAASRINREYRIVLADGDLDGVETPRELLDAVNAALVRV